MNVLRYFYQIIPIPGGPLITEDAAGNFILVGILEAKTSTKGISDKIRNCLCSMASFVHIWDLDLLPQHLKNMRADVFYISYRLKSVKGLNEFL